MKKNYLKTLKKLNLEVLANIYLIFSALVFILSVGYYVNEGNLATSDSSASAGPVVVGPGGTCVPNETVIDICEGTGICCQCGRQITGKEIGNKCLPQGVSSCTTYCENLFNEYAASKGYDTIACGTVMCSSSVGCCDSPRSMCGNDPSCLSSDWKRAQNQTPAQPEPSPAPQDVPTTGGTPQPPVATEPVESPQSDSNAQSNTNFQVQASYYEKFFQLILSQVSNDISDVANAIIPGNRNVSSNTTLFRLPNTTGDEQIDNSSTTVSDRWNRYRELKSKQIEQLFFDTLNDVYSGNQGTSTNNSNSVANQLTQDEKDKIKGLFDSLFEDDTNTVQNRNLTPQKAAKIEEIFKSLFDEDINSAGNQSQARQLTPQEKKVEDLFRSVLFEEVQQESKKAPEIKKGEKVIDVLQTLVNPDTRIVGGYVLPEEVLAGAATGTIKGVKKTIEAFTDLQMDRARNRNGFAITTRVNPNTQCLQEQLTLELPGARARLGELEGSFKSQVLARYPNASFDDSKINFTNCEDGQIYKKFKAQVVVTTGDVTSGAICKKYEVSPKVESLNIACSEKLAQEQSNSASNFPASYTTTTRVNPDNQCLQEQLTLELPEGRARLGELEDRFKIQVLARYPNASFDDSKINFTNCEDGQIYKKFKAQVVVTTGDVTSGAICKKYEVSPKVESLNIACSEKLAQEQSNSASNLNSSNNITASVLGASSDLSEIDEVLFVVSTYNDLLKNEETELNFDPNQVMEEIREYVLSGDTNNLPAPAKKYADKFIKNDVCYGDLDSDGSVNLKDLARYAKIYGGLLQDSGKLVSLSRFAQNYNKITQDCSYLFDLEVINE
ncbi:MAG: hypothetical protein KatS3mg086_136 [Candidatus Dojkabacteria bacterium]|nr:MAG: hypothetical protein KatS3mg086_136 [Candidatus Dojkabacteria bacterium]